ncbi:SRPBCC family protein [Segetibacter aerophilus]|uniref:Activator of Hsp90 ATPase homologue 1/2-like C-terminal domain-containing protein n=1 Tax=Segetibacter aerophilus TaxID=670293 RepID=A0A512BH61_9BACT|nr:SRPBCC family protein [Segetibacter aerophilus]GEO11304.1 hypothetical protein SAE01_38000 [Segetibacter aerophilus]
METNNSQKIEVSKQFSVPVEKLYQAWNDPQQLKQWWKPMGKDLKDVTNDLKEGGEVRYTFEDESLVIAGKYEEVKPNERLAYTWDWQFPNDAAKNAAYKLTIEFASKGSGSEIRVTQEDAQSEENLHPNENGWEKGLSDLESFLGGDQPQGSSGQQEQSNAAAHDEGYQGSPEQEKVGGG